MVIKISWGYRHATTGIETDLQRNKKLINETTVGTKIYKTSVGNGICKVIITWHDNRKTNFNSYLVIRDCIGSKPKVFDISNLKTQKEIFNFAAEQIKYF